MPDFLNPVKGFGVTFRQMFRKVDTVSYPEVKRPTAPRFHGRHQLNRWPDGLEKCIGCELCAWACPLCGLCVEACPTRALTMTNEYELADDSRESLIWTKEELLAPLAAGMEAPPHPMRLGDTERDYYRRGAGEGPAAPGAEQQFPTEDEPEQPASWTPDPGSQRGPLQKDDRTRRDEARRAGGTSAEGAGQ